MGHCANVAGVKKETETNVRFGTKGTGVNPNYQIETPKGITRFAGNSHKFLFFFTSISPLLRNDLTPGIALAPKTATAPTPPAVGIFWLVNGVLVLDRSTLDEGEPYGDCIGHAAGHYGRWQEWQALGMPGLASAGYPDQIAWTEYDEWPRGRIVYDRLTRRFMLYADKRLQKPAVIDAVKTAFGLNEAEVEVSVKSDSHYR
jgi:hypothetical protein